MADTLQDKFEAWARVHLGQDFPLTMDENVYEYALTRWAFKAFVAGRASRPGVKLDPTLKAALEEAAKTGATSAMLPNGEAVFINRGHDYGDSAHLECTACGGSGHIDDQRAALASRPAEVDEATARNFRTVADAGSYSELADWLFARAMGMRPVAVDDKIPRASNDALIALAKYWKLDGDWMTCKGCRRSLIASRDGEELAHGDGCKFWDQQHPWAQLRELIARRPAPAGVAQ